ncbi:MAG: pantothenic acid transporter pant, partial [Streptococcus sp.]|nr:pantothenic acid transporter pant [Streptococcus sp.]
LPNRIGLILSGLAGTLTNTFFVLLGIFIFFSNVYQGNIELLLAGIVSVNSIAEMLIASLLTFTIIPRIESLKK